MNDQDTLDVLIKIEDSLQELYLEQIAKSEEEKKLGHEIERIRSYHKALGIGISIRQVRSAIWEIEKG